MSWTVRFSGTAEKYYKRLDSNLRKRVSDSLKALSALENPLTHPQVRPLVGKLKGFYRLRIGKHRVIFSLLEETKTIAVVNIYPRGEAYKD